MLYAIVAILVLILDQAVKYWVTVAITLNEGSVTLIPGIINLVNIHNYGAAFGILENARWFFILIALIFVVLVIYALWKNIFREPLGRWSAVLVMAGAIGNCIDRVINGYVVDMFQLDFTIFGWVFAVFNVADILITVCGILFCVYIIFNDDFKKKSPAGEEKPKKSPRMGKKISEPENDLTEIKEYQPAKPVDDDGVRTYSPKKQQSVKPVTPKTKKADDPFSEWAAMPTLDKKPSAKDVLTVSSVSSTETVSKAPPAAKLAKQESEFSLDDILAEYSTK